jgi:hypothetical protein
MPWLIWHDSFEVVSPKQPDDYLKKNLRTPINKVGVLHLSCFMACLGLWLRFKIFFVYFLKIILKSAYQNNSNIYKKINIKN